MEQSFYRSGRPTPNQGDWSTEKMLPHLHDVIMTVSLLDV